MDPRRGGWGQAGGQEPAAAVQGDGGSRVAVSCAQHDAHSPVVVLQEGADRDIPGGVCAGETGLAVGHGMGPPPTLVQTLAKGCLTHPSSGLDQLQPTQPEVDRFTSFPSPLLPPAPAGESPPGSEHRQPLLDKTPTSSSPGLKGEEQGRDRRKKRRKAPSPQQDGTDGMHEMLGRVHPAFWGLCAPSCPVACHHGVRGHSQSTLRLSGAEVALPRVPLARQW